MSTAYPLDLSLEDLTSRVAALRNAARDSSSIKGSTHGFYRYPARFSPKFAATAIEAFSTPGALVLDPFMGGGTTMVEAARLGRSSVGSDINALSLFVTRVKTTRLRSRQLSALSNWADTVIPELRYSDRLHHDLSDVIVQQTRNLHLPHARTVKKLIALAIESLVELPDAPTRRFARCALLRAGQWALNGRRKRADCAAFRESLQDSVYSMIAGIRDYGSGSAANKLIAPTLVRCAAEGIHAAAPFVAGAKADLVVTSPPYPGIHILYHRWQVDGRKETPAPYWISNTRDGKGTAFYNLGDRTDIRATLYFEKLYDSLRSIRAVMKDGAIIIQMVAFNNPRRDLPRYLSVMNEVGFTEFPLSAMSPDGLHRRIWRSVPNRAWHATMKGNISASREVVFLHSAT